jgi:hypothetical protein
MTASSADIFEWLSRHSKRIEGANDLTELETLLATKLPANFSVDLQIRDMDNEAHGVTVASIPAGAPVDPYVRPTIVPLRLSVAVGGHKV